MFWGWGRQRPQPIVDGPISCLYHPAGGLAWRRSAKGERRRARPGVGVAARPVGEAADRQRRKDVMRLSMRLFLVALTAAAGLALLAGVGSANRSFGISPSESIRLLNSGLITFEEPSAVFGLACNVTFNAHIATIAAKSIGNNIGRITEGRTSSCRDTFFGIFGSATLLVSLFSPFNLSYTSFLGVLPRINGILVRADMRMLLTTGIGSCLYETTAFREAALLFEVSETGRITRLRFLRESIRLLTRLSGTCPASGSLSGAMTVSPTQTISLL